jgi:septal ring factor EnvC (AmiA/AmiB activator)
LILKDIKKDKIKLEQDRSETTDIINKMQGLINKLYSDKSAVKKREEELARRRAEQNNAIKGNFIKMKGKLQWPAKGEIISKFGLKKDPKTGVIIENVGIDIKVNNNTKIKSVLDGVVSTITFIRGHGKVIIIDHGEGFSTVYAQVENIEIHENEYVQMGSTIATVSNPNQQTSTLHFEIWGNQKKLDPQIWLMPQ